MPNNAVLTMPGDCPREHIALDFGPDSHQIINRVLMCHSDDVLLDYRPGIKISCHVVGGRAD